MHMGPFEGARTAVLLDGGYDGAAVTLFAAMTTAPTSARKVLIDRTIRSLKAAGIWSKLDDVQVYAAHDEQAALLNWKNPGTFNGTNVSGTAFVADRGFTGDGVADYIDTNFNPSTAGGNYAQNSACFGVWNRTTGVTAGSDAGWFDGTDGTLVDTRGTSDTVNFRINQAAASNGTPGAATDGSGLGIANRSASNATQYYRNGVAITVAGNPNQVSTALNNATLNCGRVTAASFNINQFAACIIGGSLSAAEQAALYAAMLAYMQGVGAA